VKIQYDDRGEGIPIEYQLSFCGYFPADKPKYSIIVSLNKLGLPASGGGMAGVLFHNVAEWIATHPEGTTSNTAIKGYTLDDSHNLGTLTVKEEGFIRADGLQGATLREIGTLNLKDGCTIISPAGTTFDGANCQFIDSEGNAVTYQPLALGKMKQISRIDIDGFTWPQHNQLGDYEVSTQTEGVKDVVVEYRDQESDLTVFDPTHVFKAGEWLEVDFIVYPELGYEFISNGMQGTRVVVPTADNSKNNTYRYYNVPDGGRRFYFDDYMVPTPDNSIATGIDSVANDQLHATGGTWYTLDGQQLNTKPTQKGIYLFKGKKVVVR